MLKWLERLQADGRIEIACRTILPNGELRIEYRTTDPITEYSRELQQGAAAASCREGGVA